MNIVRTILLHVMFALCCTQSYAAQGQSPFYKEGKKPSLLLSAVRTGNSNAVSKNLTQNPSSIYCLDEDGNTALHLAASQGKKKIVEELLNTASQLGNDFLRALLAQKNDDDYTVFDLVRSTKKLIEIYVLLVHKDHELAALHDDGPADENSFMHTNQENIAAAQWGKVVDNFVKWADEPLTPQEEALVDAA